jgi:uncharacterized protein YaaQ
MKLIIAVVQDDDSDDLMEKITSSGFRVTKLATTGGFLRAGNTTLIIGLDEKDVDGVVKDIKEVCKKREQIIPASSGLSGTGTADGYTHYPVQVEVGGATVFVVDVDKFIRI